MKIAYIVCFFVLFSEKTFAQQKGRDIFRGKTKIEDPLKLRDPFRGKDFFQDSEKRMKEANYLKDGIYTNMDSIESVSLGKIKITGVIIGKERRAVARIDGGKTGIILKEGMKIGEDQAEIKAILPGGIVLVEKITNVYGQDEYLETVIPISK